MTPERFGGPLPVRNQHPLQLTALRLLPASATTPRAGTSRLGLSLAYSSLFLFGQSMGNEFVMDGELLRVGVETRHALSDSLELAVELPVAHTSGGFLDHFVEEWHDVLQFHASGRDSTPENQFLVRADYQGDTIYELEKSTLRMLDVPISLTWQVLPMRPGRSVALAVRAAVELPTGDEDAGYGNGGVDLALGVVGEWRHGPFALTAHAEHSFVHTPDRARAVGFEYTDVSSFGVGVETALTEDIAALVQFELDRPVLRRLEGVHTDEHQWVLWLGLRGQLSEDVAMEIGFGEDLTLNGPPDFTAYLGFSLTWGG